MSDKCEKLERCKMFKLFSMDTTKNYYRKLYCESDFSKCERYIRSSKKEEVPENLLPCGKFI